MNKIGLIIDSTTILDKEVIEKYEIEIVSLNIIYKDKSYPELEVSDDFIIKRLDDVKSFKTASPAPQDFTNAYQKLWDKGFEEIIVVTLSKELSATHNTALVARESNHRKEHIHVIDTNICNFGVAGLIESMLPFIDEGHDINNIVDEFQRRADNTELLFSVTDLKHLYHGGRLSRISAVIGTLLKIKPIIEMIDGSLKLSYKVRHSKALLDIFLNYVKKHVENYQNTFLKIVHINSGDLINRLIELIQALGKKIKITTIERINPVFLTHLGNEGIGISLTSF